MDEPTLRNGDTGEWVTYLQQLLQQQGFLAGEPDGDFGPATRAAVLAFQGASDLGADGVVGARTWAALTGEGSGGTGTSGGADGEGSVPEVLREAGAPADLAMWTDDQREAFFEGTVSTGAIIETEPEDVAVLAMAGSDEGDGGRIA